MYFKRLEAQGFKSFANKTTLEFGPGITCIVGPNGTGKTNVADSLRWVLGEHSSKMLRARKTEDVVFAGSEKRAPMGFAEVSITLDNSSHWLPIEFEDVVVTRRAYRGGDNEYLINNARVRLRDVIDLFLRAQVGQNSYAFMGQGMVEQALSLRPEDRRALIEEAADVRLYRNRLEDARHKLKATRENMDRVSLIVSEIRPRINSLERQAGRAERYRELTQELAAALHAWYAHQWRECNDLLLAAITTQDQRSEDLEQAAAAAKACDDGLTQLKAAIRERRNEIELRDGRLRSLRDYARDLERRATLDEERGKLLLERVDELAREIDALRADKANQEALGPLPDFSEREAILQAARDELDARSARLERIDEESRALQRVVLEQGHAAARARGHVEDVERRIEDARASEQRLAQDTEAATRALREALTQVTSWARAYASHSADVAAALRDIDESRPSREAAERSLERVREEQEAIEDEVRALRAETEALRMKIELLQRIELQPQAPDAGVRAILEAGGLIRRDRTEPHQRLDGVIGLVLQLVRVPSGMEKAIEAALAENLFAVVFERQADLRAAVDMLLAGEDGRATMYALDSFHELRPLNIIKERGIIGVASALVRCDSRYRRLVDTLLGRTIIVEDASIAQRMLRRGLAQAVATLDGVLYRPIGSVAAGPVTSVQAAFLHERETGDLPRDLTSLQAALAEREGALADAAMRVDAAQHQWEAAERSHADAVDRKAIGEAALAAAKLRLAPLAAAVRAGHVELRRHNADLAQIRNRAEHLAADREASMKRALEAEEAEEAAQRGLAEITSAREQAAAAVAEQTAVAAKLEGDLRIEKQATEPDRAALERLAQQIVAKEEQSARLHEEMRTIDGRLAATRRELAEKNDEVSALAQELEPARRELAQFESRERSLSNELIEATTSLRTAERALMEAENDVRIRRDELETLRVNLESEGFITTPDGEVERAPVTEEPEPTHEEDEEGRPPGWMRDTDGGDLAPIRGGTTINPTEVRDRIAELRGQIRALGPVNEQAASDYDETRERYDFLSAQLDDLQEAEAQLQSAIDELEGIIRERFKSTFGVVNKEFERYFGAFFRGGTARLELGDTDEDGLPGVEIFAQPPGKKLGSLALLSGGERSLTAVALLFALLQANPSPICVLDEVDAALDEANVGRFVEELRQLAERTQFIIITHNRRTIEIADTIYGVSMGADSVSRVLSLKLSDLPQNGD